MQDEHFQRYWDATHGEFANGIERGIAQLAAVLSARAERGKALLDKARLTTAAVLIGLASGLTAGAALLATVTVTQSAHAVEMSYVYTGPQTLA